MLWEESFTTELHCGGCAHERKLTESGHGWRVSTCSVRDFQRNTSAGLTFVRSFCFTSVCSLNLRVSCSLVATQVLGGTTRVGGWDDYVIKWIYPWFGSLAAILNQIVLIYVDPLVEEHPFHQKVALLLGEGGPNPLTFILNANLLVSVKLITCKYYILFSVKSSLFFPLLSVKQHYCGILSF